MDVNNVSAGIVTRAKTISGLNGLPFAPDNGEVPLFWVGLADITYDLAMSNGHDEMVFDCLLAVTAADDEAAHTAVRQYLAGSGSNSIRAAMRGDKTLGGAASDCRVVSARGPINVDLGGVRHLGAQFSIWVGGRGDA